jgi:hypothetical protein
LIVEKIVRQDVKTEKKYPRENRIAARAIMKEGEGDQMARGVQVSEGLGPFTEEASHGLCVC